MGVYEERILPRIIDRACGTGELRPQRERVTAGLTGTVLELGFGSGHNVAHYPPAVTEVLAVEPSLLARELAASRVAASPVPVSFVGLEGERVPLPDDSCDSALSTFTLCTIPGVEQALAEVRRILRPGGRFHFLEHGRAPDEGVVRWQRRIDRVWPHVAGGCHVSRSIPGLLRDAGFEVVELEEAYGTGPKPWMWLSVGVAAAG